ncbi:uncharacterized protein LOC135680795 [Rhopilema esculentum]|uniref:uncharacterized protein LOC135680795 n=1 Tax=Rhopilema esculentum TaxID=499914 RepID=UPI0031D038C2
MSVEEQETNAADKMEEEEKNSPSKQKSPKKSNKPQMEKKRRERINNSLDELKLLILGAMKKDASYYSKLEKADILEMAVDHVRNLQKQVRTVQNPDADPMAKYRAGFITCASEVTRMIMGFPGLDESIKFNVMKHLASCCTVDQRSSTKDNKIKQELPLDPGRGQEVRIEPARTQDVRIEPVRSQDTRVDPVRSQDVRIDPARSLDVRLDAIRGQEPTSSIGMTSAQLSQIVDSRTVGEKRAMYQQLLTRAGTQVKRQPPEPRLKLNQYTNGIMEYRLDDQTIKQFSPGLKTKFPPSVVPWTSNVTPTKTTSMVSGVSQLWVDSNNNTECSIKKQSQEVGFDIPHKTSRPDGSLIKPVPQMPEKVFISGGIKFMPATVLVPVQVEYAPFEYGRKSVSEEKRDVWRPWEKMEHLSRNSKASHGHSIFTL